MKSEDRGLRIEDSEEGNSILHSPSSPTDEAAVVASILASRPPAVAVARAIYRRNGLNFKEDLNEHLRDGAVISTPNYFAMARAVELKDGRRAWFIKIAVGEMRELLRHLPFSMPYISFRRSRRGNIQKVYPFDKLLRISHLASRISHPASP